MNSNGHRTLALAHDYLIQMGGAERVVAAMVRRHLSSPLYTSTVRWDTLLPEFHSADIRCSWMQRLPGIEVHFKKYFALYPAGFHSFGVIDAPAVWVSASTFAKFLRTSRRTPTVLYCHNPTRFLWQAGDQYVDLEVRVPLANRIVRCFVPWLRRLDFEAAQNFDVIVANSKTVKDRITKYYRRTSTVVHPPVEISRFTPTAAHDDTYLVVSRLVAYKAIDRAVIACSRSGRKLLVVGKGPDRERLESLAGPTVTFLGWKSDADVQALMQRCRAFVFSGEEDFGIAPVEAQACGKPVIAYSRGGALETVIEGESGCFFAAPTVEAVLDAIERSERIEWDPVRIRRHAEFFDEDHFHRATDETIAAARDFRRERLARQAVE